MNGKVALKLRKEELRTNSGPILCSSSQGSEAKFFLNTHSFCFIYSSAQYVGHRLTAFWAKGPDVLRSLVGCEFNFRKDQMGVAGVISKMYYSIRFSEKNQHTRQFLWLDIYTDKCSDHHVWTLVLFGNQPSHSNT